MDSETKRENESSTSTRESVRVLAVLSDQLFIKYIFIMFISLIETYQ